MAGSYKFLLFSLGLMFFLVGCGDDSDEVTSSNTNSDGIVWNLIETEPTLSLAGIRPIRVTMGFFGRWRLIR